MLSHSLPDIAPQPTGEPYAPAKTYQHHEMANESRAPPRNTCTAHLQERHTRDSRHKRNSDRRVPHMDKQSIWRSGRLLCHIRLSDGRCVDPAALPVRPDKTAGLLGELDKAHSTRCMHRAAGHFDTGLLPRP
ncbi:hypothetical protein D3C85_1400100 [compost metagenome]